MSFELLVIIGIIIPTLLRISALQLVEEDLKTIFRNITGLKDENNKSK